MTDGPLGYVLLVDSRQTPQGLVYSETNVCPAIYVQEYAPEAADEDMAMRCNGSRDLTPSHALPTHDLSMPPDSKAIMRRKIVTFVKLS